MQSFQKQSLKKLFVPAPASTGEDNGQVVIIGGSSLFHGAPLFSLVTASRFVDMVFFSSPEPSVGKVAERLKSRLFSFIWVPFPEIGDYIRKSDACLIGPGFMRFSAEKNNHHLYSGDCDDACQLSRNLTQDFLARYPDKRWVIDAGSLQVMDPVWIPENAILTPNRKEFKLLFNNLTPQAAAKKYHCTIVLKGPETIVCSADQSVIVKGGNPGMTKGGTGDVQAGLTVALLAKNEPFLAASAASFIVKAAADELYQKVGVNYNADDLALQIPESLKIHLN